MTRLILVGPRGSGKTAAGQRVAEQLGAPFVDTDALIETRAGRSVAELFAEAGEQRFRELERLIIADLDPPDPCVIATGGGAVLDPGSRQRLRTLGQVVYLHAAPEILGERTRAAPRPPLLSAPTPEEEARRVLAARESLYREVAHTALDTGELELDDLVIRLVQLASTPPGRTRRQRLRDLLEEGPWTVRTLAERLQIGIREVTSDLEHLRRSLRNRRLHLEPSRCLACDFVLAKRERFTAPSRCPRCRSENLTEPELFID